MTIHSTANGQTGGARGRPGIGRTGLGHGFLILVILAMATSVLVAGNAVQAEDSQVKIGVLAKRGFERCLEKWTPTAEYLSEEIPDQSFVIVPLDFEQVYSAVEAGEVDFIHANSSFYVELEYWYGASRILTLKNLHFDQAYTVFGGVVFCKAERADIKALDDLKGKTFMAVKETSFGGWRTSWRELKEHGIDPYRDFKELTFGGTHDAVIYAVRDGIVDAGCVRTDALERMASEGNICLDDFWTFPHDHTNRETCFFSFLHFTRLYPEWPLAKVKHTPDILAEQVAATLLKMSPESRAARAARCAGWTIPQNYQSVRECLKYLRVGPYKDYGKVAFRDVLWQYLPWFLGALIAAALIVLFALSVARLNRKLQSERDKLQSLVDGLAATGVGIDIVGIDYNVLFQNRILKERFGDLTGELCYEKYMGLQEPCDLCPMVRAIETKQVESVVLTGADGCTYELLSAPLPNPDGTVDRAIEVVVDITKRKQVEEQLRLLSQAVGSSIDGLAMGDLDEWITYANKAFIEMFGYSREELVGRPIAFIYPEDQMPMLEQAMKATMAGGWTGELIGRRKNGERFPMAVSASAVLDDEGNIIAHLASHCDITERKQAEEEIRKFKTISDNASYGCAIFDLDGDFVYINECFAAMHGYTPEELLGQNLAIFHTQKQMKTVKKIYETAKRTGSYSSVEVWHKHRDGSEFPTLMNGVLVNDSNGNPAFLAAVATDISELKRLQEFAGRAQRLEEAGRIAGQVAHDFNNLLGPLMAYPELIKKEVPDSSSIQQMLTDMETAASRMCDINQELLTLGRRGHYDLELMNLNEIVEHAIKQIRPVPDKLVIEKELSPNLMNIKGGGSQLLRAVSNLIVNACDAMQDVGRLTVRTENFYVDEKQGELTSIPRGEYVKLTVTDTGGGIDADVLPKIFDPFFTTKKTDKKKGSGLGLSVVHAVLEDHSGHIDCDSVPGRGTSFYLYFPITRENLATPTTDQIVGGDESILVVDDDEQQRNVTRNLLEKLGYRVETAESGEEAVNCVKSKSPDLLILDMIMPDGIDGAETYRQALEINPSQKAIIMSGYADSERVQKALKLGAGAFVKKPLTLKSIAQAVRQELSGKKLAPLA
ncbi:MAG: PAS domain S-box protein [candidate division Zixibacteria bacterium]|nr:PAS domain S-box protein [candidate division Zixibacteria bacterium]